MKQSQIDIGIPAYNEASNIRNLIKSLIGQKNISIRKILVFSDGSTDKTNEIVENIRSRKLLLIKSPKRCGQANAQNIIFEKSTSEVLILINADVKITDKYFLYKLALPITKDHSVCLTSAKTLPVLSTTFFENIISTSHYEKNKLYESISADNIYLCHGRARAFSKKLYKNFKFPKIIAEDAYSYLINKKHGFKFKYVPDAEIHFRSPSTLSDHLKQSRRFISGINDLTNHFEKKKVLEELRIPKTKMFKFLARLVMRNPIKAGIFLVVLAFTKMFGGNSVESSHIWQISYSSKKI